MKKLFILIFLIVLSSSVFLLVGCSDLARTNPLDTTTTTVAGSTTTTLNPLAINSFLSVDLGDSSSEVTATLGAPYSTSSNGYYIYEYTISSYSSLASRFVYFNLPTWEVVAVLSRYSNDNIRGVEPNDYDSKWVVESALGDSYNEVVGTSDYIWNYPDLHILISFSYSSNYVTLIGMYDPDKITFTPN